MPSFPRRTPRSLWSVALALVGAVAGAVFHAPPVAAQISPSDATPGCVQWDLEYSITGSLRIAETPMAAGDGTFPIGPGTLVLRVDARPPRVSLMDLQLHERFAIRPTAVMWKATLVTDVTARALPDGAAAVAVGSRTVDGVVQWAAPLKMYRSDGVLTCDGSLCGRLGAPPPGRSELHQASRNVRLQPFRFDRDGQGFRMDFTLVSSAESPRQRTYLALVGRRTRKSCVAPAPVDTTAAKAGGDPHAVR